MNTKSQLDSFKCEICSQGPSTITYSGPIRDGKPGKSIHGEIRKCAFCGVERLLEEFCLRPENYETSRYRENLGQGVSTDDFLKHADPNQLGNLSALGKLSLRNKSIADVGAGGGAFLDHISGITAQQVAIEPTLTYHHSLSQRGFRVYQYVNDALEHHANSMDIVVALQVVEHVQDPVDFLRSLAKLLRPGGTLVVSTPNRDDILMDLAKDVFPSFFYRTQHRWYFDISSLLFCGEISVGSNFKNLTVQHHHTLGLSNTFFWLRDGKPKGNTRLGPITEDADSFWSLFLRSNGRSDSLFLFAEKDT